MGPSGKRKVFTLLLPSFLSFPRFAIKRKMHRLWLARPFLFWQGCRESAASPLLTASFIKMTNFGIKRFTEVKRLNLTKVALKMFFLTFTLKYKNNFYKELARTRREKGGPVLPARPTFPEVEGGKGGGGGGLNRGRSVGPSQGGKLRLRFFPPSIRKREKSL